MTFIKPIWWVRLIRILLRPFFLLSHSVSGWLSSNSALILTRDENGREVRIYPVHVLGLTDNSHDKDGERVPVVALYTTLGRYNFRCTVAEFRLKLDDAAGIVDDLLFEVTTPVFPDGTQENMEQRETLLSSRGVFSIHPMIREGEDDPYGTRIVTACGYFTAMETPDEVLLRVNATGFKRFTEGEPVIVSPPPKPDAAEDEPIAADEPRGYTETPTPDGTVTAWKEVNGEGEE
jgi:hypothetical protein